MSTGRLHQYHVQLLWTGNRGSGTSDRRSYSRAYELSYANKPTIAGSSDVAFGGAAERWNPEELLLASLSACHKLWYLDLCARNKVVVTAYADSATATMKEDEDGNGCITGVTLRPCVELAKGTDVVLATSLHREAHRYCFIANSVNFPVVHEPHATVR